MYASFQEIVEYTKTGEEKKRHDFLLCKAFGALLQELNWRYKRREIDIDEARREKDEMEKQYNGLLDELGKQAEIWKERQRVLVACGNQVTTAQKMIKDGADPEKVILLLCRVFTVMMEDPFLEREAEIRWSD